MSPARLRAYVLIITRDVIPPALGVYLTIYLARTEQLAYWQLPFLAGLLMVPLVGRSPSDPPLEISPDTRPPPDTE
jgi:hypothetical protein